MCDHDLEPSPISSDRRALQQEHLKATTFRILLQPTISAGSADILPRGLTNADQQNKPRVGIPPVQASSSHVPLVRPSIAALAVKHVYMHGLPACTRAEDRGNVLYYTVRHNQFASQRSCAGRRIGMGIVVHAQLSRS